MRCILIRLILPFALASGVLAAPDTLRDTTQIEDAVLYSREECSWQEVGEDCRHYNSGGIAELPVGADDLLMQNVVMRFPGWDRTLPDSSTLLLHCKGRLDAATRRIFVFPLVRDFIEGHESMYGVGGIPDNDSGVTWLHAWLHAGIGDSLSWSAEGGDYTTGVACTATVADTGEDVAIRSFNRILAWFDSTGETPAIIVRNENAFPVNTGERTFVSSEGAAANVPRLVLYYPDTTGAIRRRRSRCTSTANR